MRHLVQGARTIEGLSVSLPTRSGLASEAFGEPQNVHSNFGTLRVAASLCLPAVSQMTFSVTGRWVGNQALSGSAELQLFDGNGRSVQWPGPLQSPLEET
eukprot:5758719-Amphidinium_carterae.1